MQASVTPPRKTDLARELLAPGQRRLPPALRALLITVDGKRNAEELRQLGRGLGLGDDGLTRLVDQGLVEVPVIVVPPPVAASPSVPPLRPGPSAPPVVTGLDVIHEAEVLEAAALARAAQERARRLVSAKFFGLDLVTRMLAGREGELRDLARQADTESRFMEWVDLCCERIATESDAERATKFRDSVERTLTTG
jgi:hypothetical protein